MPKSPNEKRGGCPKTRASCPTPTFIFKPKTNESNTSPADCREVVQDDRLDDEPANLINNESMVNTILEVFDLSLMTKSINYLNVLNLSFSLHFGYLLPLVYVCDQPSVT